MTPLKRGTKDYLMRIIVPSLIEGLTQLSISRPQDPHLFLAKFLLNKSPAAAKHEVTKINDAPAAGSALAAVRSRGAGGEIVGTSDAIITRAVDVVATATASSAAAVGGELGSARSAAILSGRTDSSLLQYLSDVEEGGAAFGNRPLREPPVLQQGGGAPMVLPFPGARKRARKMRRRAPHVTQRGSPLCWHALTRRRVRRALRLSLVCAVD